MAFFRTVTKLRSRLVSLRQNSDSLRFAGIICLMASDFALQGQPSSLRDSVRCLQTQASSDLVRPLLPILLIQSCLFSTNLLDYCRTFILSSRSWFQNNRSSFLSWSPISHHFLLLHMLRSPGGYIYLTFLVMIFGAGTSEETEERTWKSTIGHYHCWYGIVSLVLYYSLLLLSQIIINL